MLHPTSMSHFAVLLTMIAATVSACQAAGPPSAPNALLGKRVEFSLPADDGSLVSVPFGGAQITIIDFFGPTCGPCKQTVPALLARKDVLASKGATVVLVAVLAESESTEDARKALEFWGVAGQRFLVDKDGTGMRDAGVRDLPSTVLLDEHGVLRWSAPPGATADEVVAAVPGA